MKIMKKVLKKPDYKKAKEINFMNQYK
jgi:hypothetical protein